MRNAVRPEPWSKPGGFIACTLPATLGKADAGARDL